MSFKLPKLQGSLPTGTDIVFFSCNFDYYEKYGIALINSLIGTLPWISVHCHLILKDEKFNSLPFPLVKNPRISYTYEQINNEWLKQIPVNEKRIQEGLDVFDTTNRLQVIEKTYYASVRFMRLDELFTDKQYVLQVDCDTILRQTFNTRYFRSFTNTVGVMPKPKDPGVFIASAITLGTGSAGTHFRTVFSQNLRDRFAKGAYWFIDQDVLRDTMATISYHTLPYDLNSWGIKKSNVFCTGKGNRKDQLRFKKVQRRWLPDHLRIPVEKEMQKEAEERRIKKLKGL